MTCSVYDQVMIGLFRALNTKNELFPARFFFSFISTLPQLSFERMRHDISNHAAVHRQWTFFPCWQYHESSGAMRPPTRQWSATMRPPTHQRWVQHSSERWQ